MNRPIIVILIGYIIGILWGLYLKISIVFLYILILIIYFIINHRYKKRKFKIFSIKRYFRYIKLFFKVNVIILIIISSFFSSSIIKYYNNKYQTKFKDGENIEIQANIISNKIEKEFYNKYKIKFEHNTYFYINVSKDEKLEYGDKINLKGIYKEPNKATNYKCFDYKNFLKTKKIYGTIQVEKIKILEKHCNNILEEVSNKIYLKIESNIKKTYEDNYEIMLGILLGHTEYIEEDIIENFSESGISHILAVSGLHITYIIFLVTNISNGIFGKRYCKIINIFVLIMYMFITGFSISVVRACIMGILANGAFVVSRKNDTINSMAISALLILLNNPYSLESISFLLSYGGTIGIIFFKDTIIKILMNIKVKNKKWKYIFIRIQNKFLPIIDMLSVTLSAQIVIGPIILVKFNNIGIAFIITNLLLNPLIGIIVLGGMIQIIVSFISIKIGIIIVKIINIPIYVLLMISKLGKKIPLGNVKVFTPEIYQIIIYYVIVVIFKYLYHIFNSLYLNMSEKRVKNIIYLLKYKLNPYRKQIKFFIIIIFIFCLIISKIPKKLKIYFIDVGQGDSTMIVTPNKKTIIVDGGGNEKYDIGKNIIYPYLLNRKIWKIDYLIISHFDTDHVRTGLYIY